MGFWCILFLGRISMFTGWWDLLRAPFRSHDHFVSADARRISDPRNYEMLTSPPHTYHLAKGANGLVAMANKETSMDSPLSPSQESTFTKDSSPVVAAPYERAYSFSQPRPPIVRSAGKNTTTGGHVTFGGESDVRSSEGSTAHWSTSTASAPLVERHEQQYTSEYQQQRQQSVDDQKQRTTSPLTWERADSALSNDRSARSGSALGREWPSPIPRHGQWYGQAVPSIGPQRSNSGRTWDAQARHARGSGALTPEGLS